jgi:hypothetical protein
MEFTLIIIKGNMYLNRVSKCTIEMEIHCRHEYYYRLGNLYFKVQ